MTHPAKVAHQYQRAARIVDRTRQIDDDWFAQGGCSALRAVGISAYSPEWQYFKLFAPPKKGKYSWWWGNPISCSEVQHNARVLALLFTAEIVKDDV